MVPSRFTKVKITLGYLLLLGVLLFSLLFIQREMERLSASDNRQELQSDSLLLLLREKDENTIRMLRVLNETNERLISVNDIEEIIAEQDSVVMQQRVQRRVITRRDSLITRPQPKGFFKRLAEAFVPSKRDSSVLVNTSLELATDTILEPYNPVDSLQQKLRSVTLQKQEQKHKQTTRRNRVQYRRLDTQLTARIDSLVKGYEQGTLLRARQEAEKGREIRQHSMRTIASIAAGAMLLSALFLILIGRDITRSNRYRRELEAANQRAEELLEAREKLMLAITHDFKAPLGSIMGYTDLLTRLTEDERQRFYLSNMKSSSEHLLKLVSDLLDFHRLDLNKTEINRVTFHPAQLFEEIRVSFQPLAEAKGLTLECQVAPELNGSFVSDPLRIRQIVNNLLSNAVKFTAEGGVTLNIDYESSRLRIAVSDTGKGMEPTNRERIFQEFTRLPGAQGEEGFGLGLSIVHKLVTLLEGSIEVESTPGKGSCFVVTLPLYPVHLAQGVEVVVSSVSTPATDAVSTSSPYAPGKSSNRGNLRVLLIDDDRIQLMLTAAMLTQQGVSTVCCEQLDELTEQLRTATFDLLLTDVQMPAINGFDLLKLLRASNLPQARTIPIFAVTARSDMERQHFLDHGFTGCLHKPFTVAELIEVVNAEVPTVDFSRLTAFSENDPEAAEAIIRTFIEETEKNIVQLEQAFIARNVDGVASMAHKLLPLYTLIGATRSVPLLAALERFRGETVLTVEAIQQVEELLPLLRQVVKEAHFPSTITS